MPIAGQVIKITQYSVLINNKNVIRDLLNTLFEGNGQGLTWMLWGGFELTENAELRAGVQRKCGFVFSLSVQVNFSTKPS